MMPRVFLVAPDGLTPSQLIACATAATRAADCASIVVHAGVEREIITKLQNLDLAVLLKDSDAQTMRDKSADGLLLSANDTLAQTRKALPSASLGVIAGASRHTAMEAAEAGVDFVCFTQTRQYSGEPIIGWWQDVTEIPVVAYDPVTDNTLKPQNPDFIRPDDAMWQSPDEAAKVVTELMAIWSA
jgi:thiamine-phosphate pyrophosphorylase